MSRGAPKNVSDQDGIYILGGFSKGDNPLLAEVLKINPENQKSWQHLAPLPPWGEYDYKGDENIWER